MARIPEERTTAFERRGFVSVQAAAALCHRSVYTIYRWLADGKVEGLRDAGTYFVAYRSLYNHVGEEAAKALEMPAPKRR
jgi:transposase